MSASLRHEHWSTTPLAAERGERRERQARLEAAGSHLDAPDPGGYFFRPEQGRSLRLRDGIARPRADAAAVPRPSERARGVKGHHVLWSAAEPWGAVGYASPTEAIHDVRATPGKRASGNGVEKGYSRLTVKKPVALIAMRNFLTGLGLHRYAAPLQSKLHATTPEDLISIRRPQLEAIGMPRPEIIVFERATTELARDFIKQERESTVARRVWGGSTDAAGAEAAEPAERSGDHRPGGRGKVGFSETMGEIEERQEWLSQMRKLGKSGAHEAAIGREINLRLGRLSELDREASMATLWREAQAKHPGDAQKAEESAVASYNKRYPGPAEPEDRLQ